MMMSQFRNALMALGLMSFGGAFAASEVKADYRLCNETSYIVDAAIGVQSRGDVTTRGWFQVVPGQCRVVVQGPLDADKYFVHSRVPNFYDYSLTQFQTGSRFCVGGGDFLIAGAANCSDPSHSLESFVDVQPKRDGDDFQLILSEEAGFKPDQAATAGAQRLLGMLGYEAGRVDGVAGSATNKALKQFLGAAGIQPENPTGPQVYQALAAEIRAKQAGVGLQICNETRHLVWTAIGVPEQGGITSKGWYKIGAGECVRPHKQPLDGQVIYSFGEAVDENGPIISTDNIPLIWDGDQVLCTKSTRFSVRVHENCEAQGLTPTRFRRIDLRGAKSQTIRYTEPG